jgi:hypothetical protein
MKTDRLLVGGLPGRLQKRPQAALDRRSRELYVMVTNHDIERRPVVHSGGQRVKHRRMGGCYPLQLPDGLSIVPGVQCPLDRHPQEIQGVSKQHQTGGAGAVRPQPRQEGGERLVTVELVNEAGSTTCGRRACAHVKIADQDEPLVHWST